MRVIFFRLAERKSPKKGRPHCLRPRRCAPGQPVVLVRGARCGTRFAPAALRSNSRSESVHEACVLRHTPPHALRSSAHTEGMGSGHPFGPLLRSAPSRGRKRLALRRLGRVQRWPVWMSGSRLPFCMRLGRAGRGVGMGVGAPMLRGLARRGCLSGARSAKRVPRRTP